MDSFIDSELIPPFHEVSAYELGLETDAVITIQSYWRGYMPRVWLTFRKTKPDVYRNPNIQWEKYVLSNPFGLCRLVE